MVLKKSAPLVAASVFTCYAIATAQATLIPRVGQAPHEAKQTFEIVRNYLLSNGVYKIVRVDPAKRVIVVHRTGIAPDDWNEWAYCKVGPGQMLDTLDNGEVTITIEVKPIDRHTSGLSTTADFEGTYSLGDREDTTHCASKGVLENQILQAADSAPVAS